MTDRQFIFKFSLQGTQSCAHLHYFFIKFFLYIYNFSAIINNHQPFCASFVSLFQSGLPCLPLPVVTNGRYESAAQTETYFHGDVVKVPCNTGYTRNGTQVDIQCNNRIERNNQYFGEWPRDICTGKCSRYPTLQEVPKNSLIFSSESTRCLCLNTSLFRHVKPQVIPATYFLQTH